MIEIMTFAAGFFGTMVMLVLVLFAAASLIETCKLNGVNPQTISPIYCHAPLQTGSYPRRSRKNQRIDSLPTSW